MQKNFAKPVLLIPVAALMAILPLILHGGSCGHDMVFHVQGWYDAAAQLRHGQYPRWSFTSAWNAGEPRFIFYPPLSWLVGAVLTMVFPPNGAVWAFIFVALTLSGMAFYRLASEFTDSGAALVASAFYVANPYMLFNAFERSAFAELLAAAWIPLLLLAALRRYPTVGSVAVPLALLWLTNAPAAVMGSYALALLVVIRLIHGAVKRKAGLMRLGLTYLAGTMLGLALPAFYLVPAAYERRFVQVEMAIIPTMRVQDNFLFSRTQDAGHNGVNLQISWLAVTLVGMMIAGSIGLLLLRLRSRRGESNDAVTGPAPVVALTILTAALVVMLLPLSMPVWNHLPELQYLQFPWRLLTVVAGVLALSLALLLGWLRWNRFRVLALLIAVVLPAGLGLAAFHLYAQYCQATDRPPAVAQQFATQHGFPPTDEYTPKDADSDVLRTTDPADWVIPAGADANSPAPGTRPTAVELDPNIDTDDTPVPQDQRVSTAAPMDLEVHLREPATLVLNLRKYPNWDVTGCDGEARGCGHFAGPLRDDGLVTMALPAGQRHIEVRWRTTADQWLGMGVSGVALLVLMWMVRLSALRRRGIAIAAGGRMGAV